MIQVLTYSGRDDSIRGEGVTVSTLHDAQSLDEFKVNIIDLSDNNFWKCNDSKVGAINNIDDFRSMANMIAYSAKAKIIILLPQNEVFLYNYWETDHKFHKSCELKNMIPQMQQYSISVIYPQVVGIDLVYENTKTRVAGHTLTAAFYFNVICGESVLTKSEKSDKPTTIDLGKDVIASTLEINTYEELMDFLKILCLIEKQQKLPEWVEEVKMFDDEKQLDVIRKNRRKIEEARANIASAKVALGENSRYKSILYTNGDELVSVVLNILEEMIGCDFSGFVDEKKEDFLTEINGKVFIGEIKGVNHNVKSENVSQLDVHYQGYLDEHEGVKESDVHALLIINHQKNSPLQDRNAVHDTQIKLSKRNGSLIVETYTLLKMFEKYKNNELTREECIDILSENTGLLEI